MPITHTPALPEAALDQLFRHGRTAHAFRPDPVSDGTLQQLYDLLKWGPTAFNAQPARFVFVRSAEAKARLKPTLSSGNVAQSMAAAVTVIVAEDSRFYEHLPQLFPAYDAKPLYQDNAALAASTAHRNSSLQGAYLILAARALGLDAGPQSGFNGDAVNQEFFPDGRWKVNFMVNLGYADPAGFAPRGPRLAFTLATQIL
jgi:nitroreductase